MPVEMIPALPDHVIGFVAKGEVTEADYTERIEPAIDDALQRHDKVRLLYVLGADFTGFSGGASWEDGKLGMKHLTRWEKIAFVSDKDWMRHAVNAIGYLVPGKVRVFDVAHEADASEWVTAD
jgi:hypothetical protein